MTKEPVSLDLILSPEVCRLLDNFAALMKVRAVFFSSDGRILLRGRNEDVSDYCALVRTHVFSLEKCVSLDREMRTECARRKRLFCYRCHAGLHEIIAPVILHNEILGFVVLGQFRLSGEPCPSFADARISSAYKKIPVFSETETGNLSDMLQMLIDYIVSREMVSLPNSRMLRIHQFLAQHLTEKITLRRLSRAAGCSESGLTHYLRKNNTSFKKLLTSLRMEEAARKLRSGNGLSVGETASALGFEDVHYFSRVFRGYYGYPPSEFVSSGIRTEKDPVR